MFVLKKTISFIAVFSVLPAAFAVTARPSIVMKASPRMPTMTANINNNNTTTSGTTVNSSTLLANAECIEAYTSCMKSADACGPNFEECTNKVLFHGKMPQCLSTLAQCSAAGVTSLYGTSNTAALSTVASTNSYGEVTNYTYPTDGSVLGQLITGAAITNRYDTSTCVRRYTSCLKKDTVCGNDFELCTTNAEFKKQRVFCDSTLARCQGEGITELFGSASLTAAPSASSRVGEMIAEGAALAAVNAVSTCYKVIDNCILGACAANPYKCYENTPVVNAELADAINSGDDKNPDINNTDTTTASSVAAYIRNSCKDTIGANKYCYATFIGNGNMPTASQLRDEDNQDEIYSEAYSARMGDGMKAQITELVNKFDTKAKNKCIDTIKSCAMRVCGSGSGAACYSQVFGSTSKSINAGNNYNEIKTGCAAIVNTDANCKYAAKNTTGVGTYSYAFINTDAFDTLFPEYDTNSTDNDPIGVIASLNASLANSYSDAAIAQMKKQCQSVASSCVKSMCGADYQNCYRNRTDVYSSLTDTGDTRFDKSMNKVGGVLDYTIVLGLCVDTVKNASVCEEHLAIEQQKLKMNNSNAATSWGDANNVRGGWIDAGSTSKMEFAAESVQAVDENGNNLCTVKGGTEQGVCYTVDANGKVYDTPAMISYSTYVESQAANTLFKDLIYDLEIEAQAKYNAKLTKEQNMCMANNDGGLMGNRDAGSTFMWVKLRSAKVPANYATAGLTPKQFVASNDLYGSFCRVRVTLQSDDRRIQDVINKGADWATAYFATGDVFTCGSWIPAEALEEIAKDVAKDATEDQAAAQKRTRTWLTILGGLGGTTGGAFLGESIRTGNTLGGLTGLGDGNKADKSSKTDAKMCLNNLEYAADDLNDDSLSNAAYSIDTAISYAKKAKVSDSALTVASNAASNLRKVVDESSVSAENKTVDKTTAIREAETAIRNLETLCERVDDEKSDKDNSGKGWITGVSTVAMGTAGALLINKATRDIQQTNLDKAQREAYDEWMNAIGRHINCYIGAEEAGQYGDIVSTSLE